MNGKEPISRLKALVLGKESALSRIYRQHSQENLFDYANSWQVCKNPAGDSDLSRPFFDISERLLSKIYGPDAAQGAISQLRQNPLVSTIDHHGILSHPFFLNSNLIFSLHKGLKYLVCFSTAGVSLNNSSWPGCLVLANSADKCLRRFSFFPDRQKTMAVLAAPSFARDSALAALSRISQCAGLAPKHQEMLRQSAGEIFLDLEILSMPSFSRQASAISTRLWERMFPSAPRVLYLPIEELVSRLIINEIAPQPKHPIYKLLFTSGGLDLIEKYFHGSLGAFTSDHKGSFLFWGLSAHGHRIHLHRQGGKITSQNGQVNFDLSPESIIESLANKSLYPTSLVCFLTLLYYGMTCLGGFNQVNWLTEIKTKFISLLSEMGERQHAERVLKIQTANFAEGNLAFLSAKGRLFKAGGADILLSEDGALYDKYHSLARQLTIGESIETLLPEIYRVTTPAGLREEDLSAITDEGIAGQIGMEQKILNNLLR